MYKYHMRDSAVIICSGNLFRYERMMKRK